MPELYSRHQLTAQQEQEPLYAALANHLSGLSRHKARLAITAGLVAVDGRLCTDAQHQVKAGSKLEVDLRQGIPSAGRQRHTRRQNARPSSDRPFSILFEDDDVIVVDKASGVLSAPIDQHSRGHVPELLRKVCQKRGRRLRYLGQVHRIDTDTSGCLIFALSKAAQNILALQFSHHVAERRYRSIVIGQPAQNMGRCDGKIGRGNDGRRAVVPEHLPGKDAVTHYEVLSSGKQLSVVECKLETGRTHQIRIHLANLGCPVLGDSLYGPKDKRKLPHAPRLLLHAHELHFDHPKTGQRTIVSAPVPRLFDDLVARDRP